MGLMGVITEAIFKLRPIQRAYINQKTVKAKNLEAALELFDEYENHTYPVAWIDRFSTAENLGRSLLMLGEHAEKGELTPHQDGNINIQCNMPYFLLKKYTIQAFNSVYYSK
jgi:decaprenylphospho-beta-D-ribofuranose 2-oxidase